MGLFNLFIFLLLPALCVRIFFLHKKIWNHKSVQSWTALLCGFFQDIFITFQLLLFFILLKSLMPHSFLLAFAFFVVFTALVQLDIIFDAFFFRKTSMRMELSFFSFFNDIRCFWDSAKEKTFLWFFPSAIFFLTMHVKTFVSHEDALFQLKLSSGLVWSCFIAGLFGLLGAIYLPKKISYQTNNAIILQEEGIVKKIYAVITRKKRIEQLQDRSFEPKGEIYTKLSQNYPLLKRTQGFIGEKQFSIRIDQEEKPHVVLLFMESFRAGNIGALGAKKSSSPHFDRLAKEGVLFSQFYANSVKTSRAVTSSLFGIPSDVYSSNISSRPSFPMIGIADILQSAGYQTSYLHNGLLQFENQFDFFQNHGYQTLIGRDEILKAYPKAAKTSWGVHDEYLMRYVADWLQREDQKGKPLFSTVFTITNHHPWTMPPDYKRAPTLSKKTAYNRYLQTFRYSDWALGLFVDLLREKGLSEKTILIVLGDHGQPMGEHHNNFSEQKGLYEENLHVPLLIIADGRIESPAVIQEVGSQLDLLPTIMDLLSIHDINHAIGSSLVRKIDPRTIFFHNPYGLRTFGARRANYKCIYTKEAGEAELYDLLQDPEENRDLANEKLEVVQNFVEEIEQFEQFFSAIYENYRIMPYEAERIAQLERSFEH